MQITPKKKVDLILPDSLNNQQRKAAEAKAKLEAEKIALMAEAIQVGKNKLPFNKKILVLPEPKETLTASGIIIPDTVTYRPTIGTIIRIAKDVEGLAEGEVIMFNINAAAPIDIDGVPFLLIHQQHVNMIMEAGDDFTK